MNKCNSPSFTNNEKNIHFKFNVGQEVLIYNHEYEDYQEIGRIVKLCSFSDEDYKCGEFLEKYYEVITEENETIYCCETNLRRTWD